MGFVNRRFEESEKRSYKVDGEEISLGRGTIDAERDIRLIDYANHQLEFGNPDNKYYELKNNLKVAQEKALANPKDVNLNLELMMIWILVMVQVYEIIVEVLRLVLNL